MGYDLWWLCFYPWEPREDDGTKFALLYQLGETNSIVTCSDQNINLTTCKSAALPHAIIEPLVLCQAVFCFHEITSDHSKT